nr:toll/interleukin-1 receptor domain-containing protein [Nitrosomonas nitrosa]
MVGKSADLKKAAPSAGRGRDPIAPLADRKIVFISHANPEDNAITAWYGSRLTAAGDEVWTDLTRLLGGEEMWLDIDDALRFSARKVLVLLSRASSDAGKEGVRAEIDRAATFRRKLGDRRFIIPVKIDDVPYEDLPPTIGNRLVIDGRANPAEALGRVLKILEEDDVWRARTASTDALLRWQYAFAPQQGEAETGEDELVTNWYQLAALPEKIYFYEIGRPLKNAATEPASIAKSHPLPMAAHWRQLVTFGAPDEVQEPIIDTTPVKFAREMSLDDFLSGGNDQVRFERGVPAKILSSLLRQAWNVFSASKGLSSYALSDNKFAWFTPKGLLDGDKINFVRSSGVKGWRALCGQYGLRDREWHFGAACGFLFGDPIRLKLTPHIVYTDPTGEKPDTVSYRRAHCKLWFNAKWRDLLYGYVTMLSDEDGYLRLPLARDAYAIFEARPIGASMPVKPPTALESKAGRTVSVDGDAEDVDMSAYADDPAFSGLVDDDEDWDGAEPPHSDDEPDGEEGQS